MSLEPSATQAHLLYNLGKTSDITATVYVTVTQGWDDVTFETASASGTVTGPDTAVTGVITLTTIYPDVSVTIRAGSAGAVVSSVSLRQR
jgi:hypothetical protein